LITFTLELSLHTIYMGLPTLLRNGWLALDIYRYVNGYVPILSNLSSFLAREPLSESSHPLEGRRIYYSKGESQSVRELWRIDS
jgi:hypothetical protein